jgi:DNA repair protein RecO (recombination protein O)
MEWTDNGIVLSARRHGESGSILDVLTRAHGRHAGLVRGSKNRALLQAGNGLMVHWRARLEDHLGSFTLELAQARAGALMEGRDALMGLNAFSAVAGAALPERLAYPAVFDAAEILLGAMMQSDFGHWGPLYVRWEAGLLEALGFGLDLSQCAATGQTDDLIYVSPKSGRAVSRGPGADYAQRLLALPGFLLGGLERPNGRELPPARLRLESLGRESE